MVCFWACASRLGLAKAVAANERLVEIAALTMDEAVVMLTPNEVETYPTALV